MAKTEINLFRSIEYLNATLIIFLIALSIAKPKKVPFTFSFQLLKEPIK
jgi:hypothetical protein